MKTTNMETLDNYFTTENEHWNTYAMSLHCKAIESGLFAKQELPIQLVDIGVNLLEKHCKTPTKAIEELLSQAAKANLTPAQQLFIYEGIDRYGDITDFRKTI